MSDFPRATCQFLADLRDTNTRTWFDANRDRYEREWFGPAQKFVEAMASPMSGLSPPHKAVPKVNGSIRRLHRDIRFSKDKTPFDPRLHMVFWTGGHPSRSPAIHIVLHPDHTGFGAGQFAFGKHELERYRQCVSQNAGKADELLSILNQLEACGCALTDETLKKVPPGTDVAPHQETLLKRKGLVAKTHGSRHPPDRLCDRSFMQQFLESAASLNNWLCGAVGGDESKGRGN